jgi:hypothetical protein
MQKRLLIALSAAIVLAGSLIASRAEASMFCGGNGCTVVQTKPAQHRKFQPLGYTRPLRQTTPPAPLPKS